MPSLLWVNQFAQLPETGGGTRHFELGRELVRRGWKVTILASDLHLHSRKYLKRVDAADRATKIEVKDGVEIRWLWASHYEVNDWRRARNWLTFYRSVLEEDRAAPQASDVVIGSSPQLFAAVAARKVARRRGVPFVFEVRDLWPESLIAAGGRRGPMYVVLDRFARRLYRECDRILVLARGTKEYLVTRGIAAEKIGHVPNGVDVEAMRPIADGTAVAPTQRPFTLIYAGAHGPANGLERVLDAAELLHAPGSVRFVLVGDGPAKAQLRVDAARRGITNVDFLDSVPKTELVGLFGQADAGIMILREAPLFSFAVSPNKLFDYLAVELPIVCNVPGEVADILAASSAGIQTVNTSAAALAQSIEQLRSMPAAERRAKGRAGRAWVEREHSRGVLGERLDGMLRGLLR